MKKVIRGGAIATIVAVALVGCSPNNSESPSDAASTSDSSSSPSSSETSEDNSNLEPPTREGLEDADLLRLAVSRFESQVLSQGGFTFQIRARDNKKPDTITVDAAGSESRNWTNDDDEAAAIYTIVNKGVYTSKTGLDPLGVELMDAVAPDAEWMLDSFNSTNYVPLSPARVLEATLAYANKVKCKEEGDTKVCAVFATGMSSMPGLGSFEAPEGGVEVTVTLNSSGDIINMVMFPNSDDFKLSLEDVKFVNTTIEAPEGKTVNYDDLVAEQQKREAENADSDSE